jgi:hypothetical protein
MIDWDCRVEALAAVKSLRAVKGVDDREVMIGWKCRGEAPGRREEALGL